MTRTIRFRLNNVSPVPNLLRAEPTMDVPRDEIDINLGQLFLQYYFDSFPSGPPNPDPSRFEYLQLVSPAGDFRFHAFVGDSSTVKKRAISTEIGQAFCRLLLHDHFGVRYFAHLGRLIQRPTHAGFGGMRINRTCKGDIPDYLCARKVSEPRIAEAKGRFSPIEFTTPEFGRWRDQFTRIRVEDGHGVPRSLKGYILATRFVTDANAATARSTSYIEDPESLGEALPDDQAPAIGRGIAALHYARVLNKLGLLPLASALDLGYALTEVLTLQMPRWLCTSPPFERTEYIGGFYRTSAGAGPVLSEKGWTQPLELGSGHLVFVGLNLATAVHVARAARGEWTALDGIAPAAPIGTWSSEFAWLFDGTVAAPAQYFIPTGLVAL